MILVTQSFAATLSSVGVQSTVTTVSATTTLSLFSTTITAVPSGGKFEIIIPSTTSIASGTLAWSMIEPSSISVSWSAVSSTRTITATLASNLGAGVFFQINIPSFTNPDSTLTTSTFEFRTYNAAGTVLDSRTTGIVLTATAGSLASATMTPTSLVVAASNTVNFNITTTHKITKGGSIQVKMPKWNPNALVSANILPMIQGSYLWAALQNMDNTITWSFSSTTDILTVSSAFPNADISAGTILRFSCSGFRNPISTAIKTGFTVTTFSGDGGRVDSLSTTLQVTTAATIASGTISSLDTKIVQTLTVMRLTFPSPVPLDAGCIIDITFPPSLAITSTDLVTIRGVGLFGTSRTLTKSIDTTNNKVTLTDGCQTYLDPDFDAILEFTKVSNPLSTRPTNSFTILIKDSSGNSIATRTTDIQYVATFGAMTSGTLSATPTTIGTTAAVSISLFPAHKITTAGALKFTFPSQVTFPATTCTLTNHVVIQTSATCSISGQIVRISNPFSTDYIPTSSSTSTISFTINSITIPGTTAPTSTFSFESVLVDSSIDYTIDKSSYTNMITATSGTITTASVTPTSTLANAQTTYTFSFVVPHAIVQSAKIVITFPSDIILPSPATSANSCTAISGLDATLVCTATTSSLTVNNGYSSSSRAAGTTVSFSITTVRNPVSLQPSSSFTIKTRTSDDYDIDVVSAGVFVTMLTVGTISSVELTPISLVNGATTNLEIKIVASSPLQNGDVLRVTFPSQVTAPSGTITCVGSIALATTLTCTKISTSPEIIQVTMSFNSTTSVSALELLKFQINNIVNPTTTEPSSTFGFLFRNANAYTINTYSGTVRVTTTDAALLTSVSLQSSNSIAKAQVNIEFSFTTKHAIPSTGVVYIYYPSKVTYNSTALSCQCLNTLTGAASTCTCEQQTVSAENRIIFRNAFPSGVSASTPIKITVFGFINPETAEATSSFKIYTDTAETSGYKIDKIESGLTITPSCNYPWLTCSTTTSTCTSCSTTYDAYKLQSNTCVLTCNQDKFYNSTTNACEDCATQCSACSTTSKSVCTKCGKTGFEYLYSGTCTSTCPSKFFGNSVSYTCDACDTSTAHCLNCSGSATTCTSCDTSSVYAFLESNICVTSWTSGIYIQNTTTNICDPCDSNCKTCAGTTTTCTSCNLNMRLDLRTDTCVNTCETGKTIVTGSTWVAWDSNCLTCAGSTTTCTSCDPSLVLTTSYTCAPNCLNTNEIAINSVCTACDPTCTTCEGTTDFCTSCAVDYALYENECVSDCPLKYEDQNRVCVYVGLVCPENYEPNSNQDACVPTIKACEGGKVLNEDKTKCIPPKGEVVPFPLLFIALWFLLVVLAGKWKDRVRSRIIGNLIPLLGIIETPGIIILAILAATVEAYITFAIALAAFFLSVLMNVIMYLLFKKHTMPDEDFKYFAKRYPKTSDFLPYMCLFWNFRVLKFFYSGFFGLDTWMMTLANSEKIFMRYFRRVIIATFFVVHIPVYAAWAIGFVQLTWGYQAFVECIEIPIVLVTILILTICERKCEKSRIDQEDYLPIPMNKYDDIAVMSAMPYHRSATKDKFDEESKTENYSVSMDPEKHDFDKISTNRKKAIMDLLKGRSHSEEMETLFDEEESMISHRTYFDEEKYDSSQRRELKRPPRRAYSFGGLAQIDEEEDESVDSEEEKTEKIGDIQKETPRLQRRSSFPMRVQELKEVENPIFCEAIDELRNTLMTNLKNNWYADSKPKKIIETKDAPVMADMGCQTMLRDLLFSEDSDEEFERIEYEDAELESDFAWNLIGEVIDNLSESSAYKEKKKLSADRLKDIPDFELEDILGEFDVDENGNFIFKTENGHFVDNQGRKVNQKGYLIDLERNIITKHGKIIFYADEVGDDGEIPAPFVFEKHKNDFLSKVLKPNEGVSIDPNYMVDDDEDLVEAELNKLKPSSRESSVESLVAENPGLYVEENLSKGRKSLLTSPNNVDAETADRPYSKGFSPQRSKVTEYDRDLARSYGGKARGSIMTNYKGQPKRIKREDTRELFPSLAVENQAQAKLSKIVDGFSRKDHDSEETTSFKNNRNQELRKQLEKLKNEHFRDLDSENLGDLNMDLIEQQIDEFDFNRQKQYEDRMRRHIQSNMNTYSKPPIHTSSNFHHPRLPFQSSDLLSSGPQNRVGTSKAQYNSRLENRSKTKPLSGLKRIYGNLGELVVPAESRDLEQPSRLHTPGSTVTLRTGFSRRPTQSKYESNSRIRGLEMIYLQKLEKKNKLDKSGKKKTKAKFRTLHNKYIDDPSILAYEEFSERNEENQSRFNERIEFHMA